MRAAVVRCLFGAGPVPEAELFVSERDRAQDTAAPLGRQCMHSGWGRKRAKRVCAQCAHPGLRIRPYRCRTGPDCGGFRGSGEYSGAGTRFESHLGHVFSLFRGLRASECAQTVHLWAPPGPIFVGVPLLWPAAPSRGSGSGGAVYSFMARGAASCMTGRWLGERCCLCWFAFLDVMTAHGDVAR